MWYFNTQSVDIHTCQKDAPVSKKEVAALPIEYHEFHGNWNYTVKVESTSTS